MEQHLDARIVERGKEFFKSISGEAPSIFNKGFWTGKVMDWAMQNEGFKVQLFRFVDVLPYLNTSEALTRHIREYFSADGADVPPVLKWGAGAAGFGGAFTGMLMGKFIRSNIEGMARTFIIGENTKEAIKGLAKLRKEGFAFTVDLLGEATVSEEEADAYRDGYLEVLDAIAKEHAKWAPLADSTGATAGPDAAQDWGHTPKVNVSIKPSALYSQAKPGDVEGSVQGILSRLVPIYRKIVEMGGFLCIDMEQLKYREMTLELFKRLRTMPEFRDHPHLSIVLQAYLRCTEHDLDDLLAWGRAEKLPFGIRLVKGAYWDYETVMAKQNGWEIPVWTRKPESDICYEKLARRILENNDLVYFACASHNVRTIATVMETARALNVPAHRYEFQVLYGMAEPVRKGLKNVAGRVRLYCPYGELIPGMAYLVRRLLENTANESFLRQSFVDGAELERLLENPQATLERELAATPPPRPMQASPDGLPPFVNESMLDLTIPANREGFVKAIAEVRGKAGGVIPLFIGGRDVTTDDTIASTNPASPAEVIAKVCQGGKPEVDAAIEAAEKAFPAWRDTSPADRAMYLRRAADIARRRMFELSAWQVLEVGKQWDQAFHDVGEGIDFLDYYAREMLRLGAPRRMGRAPGELNHVLPAQGHRRGHRAVELPLRHRHRHGRRRHRHRQSGDLQAIVHCLSHRVQPYGNLPRGGPARGRVQLRAGPQLGHGRLPCGTPAGEHDLLHRFHGSGPAHSGKGRQGAARPDAMQARHRGNGRQERHHHRRRRRPRRGRAAGAELRLRLSGAEVLGLLAGHRAGPHLRPLRGAPRQGGAGHQDRPVGRPGQLHGPGGRRIPAKEHPGIREGCRAGRQGAGEAHRHPDRGLLRAADHRGRHQAASSHCAGRNLRPGAGRDARGQL